MIHVSILALKHAVLSSISDAAAVFRKVNELLVESGKEPFFDVQLVGLTTEVSLERGLVKLTPDAVTADVFHTDLIIVPSFSGYVNNSLFVSKECAPWIAQHYKNGSEVASLCTGAFMVAFSGILNGKECTTHWAYSNEFRYFFPGVKLVDEKIVTDQDGLYSSGGSNSYWNLLIHLVEKFTNRETAIRAAKFFVIDLDKTNQSAFIIFQGLKDHEDEPVLRAQQYIEQHYWEKFTVDQLASQFNMTRRTFERRFKKATRNTVAEYIQRMKVEATKKQLEIGRKSINELMVDVGYSDIQAFREVFKRITGMTPIDYRKKYRS